jgi:peptidoglycan biosynthesis protein MviN/MurJ (putative lipid II flippase)
MKKTLMPIMFLQLLIVAAYILHRFIKPLGSDFMFGLLIAGIINGIFLLWQAFKKDGLNGWQKWTAVLLAVTPLLFLLALGYYLSGK